MRNWTPTIQAIKDGKCLIFLGPQFLEAEVDGETQSLTNVLWSKLREDYKKEISAWYDQDELFLFRDRAAKNEAYFYLKALREKAAVKHDLFQKIVSINLPLIVSFSPFLNPDSLISSANIPWFFTQRHYHMRREKDNLPMPNAERPMIYDLFGSLKEEESMVLTYSDLFDYIKAILGEKELPTNLQSIFQRSSYFIFLGFQFDKWYVQLILRLLKSIKGENSPGIWTAPEEVQHQPIVDFLENEFQIRIIQNIANVHSFVETLYQQCYDEGLLRPDEEAMDEAERNLPSNQMVSFIRKDQLEDALDFAINFFEDRNLEDQIDDCLALNGRLSRLERKKIQGVISADESDLTRNKIRTSLLSLNEQIKANE